MPNPGNCVPEDLPSILEKHCIWAATDGAQGSQADLRDLDLVGRSFWRVDLRRALLDGSDLAGANLDHADLRGADFTEAKMDGVSLKSALLDDPG